jgi:hypothetical protein
MVKERKEVALKYGLSKKKQKKQKIFIKTLADSKNSRTFASAIENESNLKTMVW